LGLGALIAALKSTDEKRKDLSLGALTAIEQTAVALEWSLIGILSVLGALVVFPWHQNPALFWVILGGTTLVMLYAHRRGHSGWRIKDTLFYGVVIGVIIWAVSVHGSSLMPGHVKGEAFSVTSGRPTFMMEADGSRVFTDVSPDDCAVTNIDGIMTATKCFSPFTGKALVVVTPEVAAKQNVFKLPGFKPTAPSKTEQPKPSAEKSAEGNNKKMEGPEVAEQSSTETGVNDFPIIDGGTLKEPLRINLTKTFYVKGVVPVRNPGGGYCIENENIDEVQVTWNESVTVVYLTPKAGIKKAPLTTVTVLSPGSEGCPLNKRNSDFAESHNHDHDDYEDEVYSK
jgi:hypothetical protein